MRAPSMALQGPHSTSKRLNRVGASFFIAEGMTVAQSGVCETPSPIPLPSNLACNKVLAPPRRGLSHRCSNTASELAFFQHIAIKILDRRELFGFKPSGFNVCQKSRARGSGDLLILEQNQGDSTDVENTTAILLQFTLENWLIQGACFETGEHAIGQLSSLQVIRRNRQRESRHRLSHCTMFLNK